MSDQDTFIVDAEDGFRAGGKNYSRGDSAPIKYRQQLAPSSRPHDPSWGVDQAPPNFGRPVVPHVITFASLFTSISKAYRNPDEAMRHSDSNARAMRNDLMITAPLFARQRMVSLLNWTVESEDDKDPKLKAAADRLKKLLERTPRFTEYKRALSEAIWYGRYGAWNQFGFHTDRAGRRSLVVKDWKPINGDKLVFRYDDGSGMYDPDSIGIKVSPAHIKEDIVAGRPEIEYNVEGTSVFFEKWERRRIAVHRHMVMDGDYYDTMSAGMIHGIGLRSFIYWTWYQKQEALAQMIEIIERTSQGFTIYYYQQGNPKAKAEAEKAARNAHKTNAITVPVDMTGSSHPVIEQIPPNNQGVQVLQNLIDNFYGDQIIRFILGQTLSSKPSATGLGSGLADLQQDSLAQIIKYDAINLEESITREVLSILRDWNEPEFKNADFFFRIQTESKIPKEELEAFQQAWQMGCKIKSQDIMERIGAQLATDNDDAVFNPQVRQMIDQAVQGPISPEAGPLQDISEDPNIDGDGDGFTNDNLMPKGADEPDQLQRAEKHTKQFGPIFYERPKEPESNPSEAQRKAGNYRKEHRRWNGLNITIENLRGSKRREEWPELPYDYGYIKRTTGRDGDHIDVCIGGTPDSEIVFVVDQESPGGHFDEHKCMLGYRSQQAAKKAYESAYTKGWRVGPITSMTIEQFKAWIKDGDTTQRVQKQVSKFQKRNWKASKRYAQRHAPAGGVTINGKDFDGGQFIPNEDWDQASVEEKASFIDADPHKTKTPDDAPKGYRINIGGRQGMFEHLGDGVWLRERDGKFFDSHNLDQISPSGRGWRNQVVDDLNSTFEQSHRETKKEHDQANRKPKLEDLPELEKRRTERNQEFAPQAADQIAKEFEQDEADRKASEKIYAEQEEFRNKQEQLVRENASKQKKLDSLPIGSNIDGWVKGIHPRTNEDIWSRNGQNVLTYDLAPLVDIEALNAPVHEPRKDGDPNESEPVSPNGQGHENIPVFKDSYDFSNLENVAKEFGFSNASNPKLAGNFALRTAKALGHKPKGKTREERSIDAAKFLESKMPHVDGLIDAAKSLGYKPNPMTRKSTQMKMAARRLVKTAVDSGAQMSGDFDQLLQAVLEGNEELIPEAKQVINDSIQHLEQNESSESQNFIDQLSNAVGGRKNLYLIGGTILAIWLGSSLIDSLMQRR